MLFVEDEAQEKQLLSMQEAYTLMVGSSPARSGARRCLRARWRSPARGSRRLLRLPLCALEEPWDSCAAPGWLRA
jgi:hypothetical protein